MKFLNKQDVDYVAAISPKFYQNVTVVKYIFLQTASQAGTTGSKNGYMPGAIPTPGVVKLASG
ncbi:hypothetical protein [Janthinobacterium sp. HH01]|uniref:hypothetical protein n=1 Tax=Janthinobacterium sp. HH01 TaxID=1198452 RepID=UPI00034C4250|nr:hypothetical protein [Janthinobacterium sp. HH01]